MKKKNELTNKNYGKAIQNSYIARLLNVFFLFITLYSNLQYILITLTMVTWWPRLISVDNCLCNRAFLVRCKSPNLIICFIQKIFLHFSAMIQVQRPVIPVYSIYLFFPQIYQVESLNLFNILILYFVKLKSRVVKIVIVYIVNCSQIKVI